jgi:hypothetical protein
MSALLVGGAVVAARFGWILTSNPVGARALDHVIVYDTDWEFGYVTAAGYVLVTCGPALIASSRLLRWFGVANLAGLLLASGVDAALISVLVLLHFRDRAQRAPASPPSRSLQPQARRGSSTPGSA